MPALLPRDADGVSRGDTIDRRVSAAVDVWRYRR